MIKNEQLFGKQWTLLSSSIPMMKVNKVHYSTYDSLILGGKVNSHEL